MIVPDSSNTQTDIEGNTRPQCPPAKHWCFTHNNYTEEDIVEWKDLYRRREIEVLVFQTELSESGTKHLQGCLSYQTKARPFGLHSSNKIHYEKKRGSVLQMRRYCVKEEEVKPTPFIRFCRGWNPPEPIRTIDPTLWWQKDILRIVGERPDDRTIHWYWGEGGIGKTSMAKYLSVHCGAIPCSGKGADMRMGVCDYMEKHGQGPPIVVIPIPRSFSCEYLSYEGAETVKDGFFYSSKYKGGVCVYNPPHLIVLANEPPDTTKLSADRWHIVEITEFQETTS